MNKKKKHIFLHDYSKYFNLPNCYAEPSLIKIFNTDKTYIIN